MQCLEAEVLKRKPIKSWQSEVLYSLPHSWPQTCCVRPGRKEELNQRPAFYASAVR